MRAMEALRTLAELSGSQWGMFTTAHATARGVSRLDLARLTDAGQLVRLANGVYRDVGAPGDEFEDLRAVWLSTDPSRLAVDRIAGGSEGITVSGASAAWLYGVGQLRADPFEFTTSKRRQSQRHELRYRVRTLDTAAITIEGGLPVTTLEQTIADLVESRNDLSLVADVLADAFRKRSLDLVVLARLLAPMAARNSFPRGDGDALLEYLMKLAGVDMESIAAEVAATTDIAPLVTVKYLARLVEHLQSPDVPLRPEQLAPALAAIRTLSENLGSLPPAQLRRSRGLSDRNQAIRQLVRSVPYPSREPATVSDGLRE